MNRCIASFTGSPAIHRGESPFNAFLHEWRRCRRTTGVSSILESPVLWCDWKLWGASDVVAINSWNNKRATTLTTTILADATVASCLVVAINSWNNKRTTTTTTITTMTLADATIASCLVVAVTHLLSKPAQFRVSLGVEL